MEIVGKLLLLFGGVGFIVRAILAMRSGYFSTKSVVSPVVSRDERPGNFKGMLVANFGIGILIIFMLVYIEFFRSPHR